MITAKPFAIAAGSWPSGGSTYGIVGSKFSLLAASEPLNIRLFVGTQEVGHLEGFTSGLEAGPFCPPFTSVHIDTQSGAAGNAIIGVGDENISYNPLGGTLSFSNPSVNASANTNGSSLSAETVASQNKNNYRCGGMVIPVNAAMWSYVEAGNDGIQTNGPFTFTKVRITNTGAALADFYLALTAGVSGGTVFTGVNCYKGGPNSALNIQGNHTSVLDTNTKLAVYPIAAGAQLEIDLTKSPIVIPAEINSAFMIYCNTQDSGFTLDLEWTE